MINMVERVFDGSITIQEALLFIIRRFYISNEMLRIGGVIFEDVDLTLWRIIDSIFVGHEYTPLGFELGSNDVVVDIGAHRGVFVGYAARHTQGQIIAIEPDLDNFQHLRRFVDTNAFSNVEIINVAMSDKRGEALFYRSNISSRHSLIGVDQKSGEELEEAVSIKTIPLDDILDRLPNVDLLKIDCEGAEYSILGAAKDQSLDKVRRLVVELHGLQEDGVRSSIIKRLPQYFREITIRELSPGLGLLFANK